MSDSVSLHQYLDARLISVQSNISSRKKLLQEMARLLALPLQDQHSENKEKEVYHCLLEREKLGNTGIGNGIALPHSRYEETDTAVIALITLTQAVDYDSLDRQPVNLAFGLLVPQNANEQHLRILADIARMMSHDNHKQRLLLAKSSEHAIKLIENWSS